MNEAEPASGKPPAATDRTGTTDPAAPSHRAVTEDPPPAPAGLWRRLFAMLYDALLIAALLMVITLITLGFTGPEGLYPTPFWYPLLLLGCWYLFVAWCWRRGGQTLGMQAWHLRLQAADGARVSWRATLIRFAVAAVSLGAGGLGYLWLLVDPQRLTWHDRASGTRVVRLPRTRRGG